jgi:ribonuclease BN (tRNA processing enzyme)
LSYNRPPAPLVKLLRNTVLTVLLATSLDVFAETKLIVLGSGTPNPDPNRTGSAYAVLVNDQAYLVDFGPGVVRSASSLSPTWGGEFEELEAKNLEYAFLTHIHSDHSAGLSDLILTPWVLGRERPLKLFGPPQLAKMAEHIKIAYEDDINYRINGSQPSNPEGYKTLFIQNKEGIVFKDSNVTVRAFKVNHGELIDSYGYTFITDDKKIVFSGDTAISDTLIKEARDADILIHEVFSEEGFQKKTKNWKTYHKAHHTSSVEVGLIANEAKPKKLVLSHILFWGASKGSILKDVRLNFTGETILAEDLMVID